MNTKKPKSKYFSPNNIPKFDRNLNLILASGLLIYGLLGIFIDDIYIPGRRARGFHFHGPPIFLVFGSFLCIIVYLITIIIDHHDRRNNEKKYILIRKVSKILGWTLFISAVLVDGFFYKLITRE